jgi:glycosyltransferase involved in cell wall biosynthesis
MVNAVTKGILYYTSNALNIRLAKACRAQLCAAAGDLPITSVSIKPLPDFGRNICLPGESGVLQMFEQILVGLEAMTEDVVFFAEHDCLYHPSAFTFTPLDPEVFYYNENNWRIRQDGFAVYFDHDSTSQLCAYRELLLEEYRERVRRVEAEGWHRNGYEPGTRTLAKGGFSDRSSARWRSEFPTLDIRHEGNLTTNRWKQSQFRDKTTCANWQESTVDKLPGWEGLKWFGGVFPKPAPVVLPPYQPKPQPNGARELSILIPARNEMWLARTVEDILAHKRANTEIIIGLDGEWADPPIADHPDVHIIHHAVSVGQRAITNECARLSRAKYVMKADAHCAFDEGFDAKMLQAFEEVGDEVTMAPTMRNLWAFDWVCPKCGKRTYQDTTPVCCKDRQGLEGEGCDNTTGFTRVIVWEAKNNPQSTAFCFDTGLHFQYDKPRQKQQKGDLVESMSLQGSAFMLTRKRYWDLNICDEGHGSWGQQGTEVALASWLSGGRVLINRRTFYGHMFRTKGGDFGFPYDNPGSVVMRARRYSQDLWFNNRHKSQVLPLAWLIEKFAPLPDWHDPSGAIVLARVAEAGVAFREKEGLEETTSTEAHPGWTQEDLDRLKAGEELDNRV